MNLLTHFYRQLCVLILLSILAVAIGTLPHTSPLTAAEPTSPPELTAGSVETIEFDNTLDTSQFGGGRFRRTALSTKQLPQYSPIIEDQPGAIQLMPIGALTEFSILKGRLPTKITDMGVVTLGNYIIIIGGNERTDVDGLNFPRVDRTDNVWVGEVNTNNGMPPLANNWTAAPALQAVQTSKIDLLAGGDVAPLSYPAVVAVPDSPGSSDGYIYVIGGFVSPPGLDASISSAAVHVGRFEDGTLTWLPADTDLMLPIVNPNPTTEGWTFGVHAAEAQMARINDKTYIYLLGGLQNYLEQDDNINGSPYIFYAEVGSNGSLQNPQTGDKGWAVIQQPGTEEPLQIPVPADATFDDMGLWYSSSVHYDEMDTDGDITGVALYLIGGQRRKEGVQDNYKYSNFIYKATIQDDGTLQWDDWSGTLPQSPLSGMEATNYDQNVYIPGGRRFVQDQGDWVADEEYEEVLSTFIGDDMQIESDTFASNDMKRNRYDHGVSIIESTNEQSSTLAFFYVVAGRSDVYPNGHPQAGEGTDPDDPRSNYGTDTILFSRIDPDDAIPVYSLNGGWYYSRPIDVSSYNNTETEKTDIVGVSWSAAVSRTETITTDIMLEYRVDSQECEAPLVFESADASRWRPLSMTQELTSTNQPIYYSKLDGSNSGNIEAEDSEQEINCFQYRAQFMTYHRNYTPILLNVGLEALTDKQPDLWVEELVPKTSDTDETTFVGLDVVIKNYFEKDKTANADFDGNSEKNFYIDMYIFSPGQQWFTPENPPTIPFIEGESEPVESHHHFYATLEREEMPAEATFPQDPNNQTKWNEEWKYAEGDNFNEPVDIENIMRGLNETGTYTACVVVDSYLETIDDLEQWPDGYVAEGDETDNWLCVPIEVEDVPVKACVMPDMPEEEEHAKEFDKETETTIKGTYTISRSVDRGDDLQIFFNIGGTASLTETEETGEPDYRFDQSGSENTLNIIGKTGSVVIPAGSLAVTFDFTPVDDLLEEGDETVRLTVIEGTEQKLYQPAEIPGTDCKVSSEIIIEDNDYAVYLPLVAR